MTTLTPVAFAPTLAFRPPRTLWLITFVDLVMVLLGFFVLVFSMSELDRPRYVALVRSYADVFHGVGGKEMVLGPVRVPPQVRLPGDNLAYLEAVLKTAFARDANLNAIGFRLTPQYLILDVPAQMTADAGSRAFDSHTQGRFFALGGVLSNLSNRIAIVAPVAVADGPDAWFVAAARARAAQEALKAAGYQRVLTAVAQGAPADFASDSDAAPIELLLFPETSKEGTP